MPKLNASLLLLGILALGFRLGAFQLTSETCSIRVSAMDAFGGPLKRYDLELRSADYRLIERNPDKGTFDNVPFGEYVVIATTSCCRATRILIVNVPKLWVRIAVPTRFGDSIRPGGDLVIRGLVRSRSQLTGYWVRVRGVFLDFSREAEIADPGRFSVSGLDIWDLISLKCSEGERWSTRN
jgi:hypothetical protein